MDFVWYQGIYGQTLIQGWEKIMIPEKRFAGLSVVTLADFL